MNIFPHKYTKNDFLEFLNKNNVSLSVVNRFLELPEFVEYRGNKYEIYIISTWYNTKKTKYSFEINYYSNDIIEFLFNSKVFNDIELSVNNIHCQLKKINII